MTKLYFLKEQEPIREENLGENKTNDKICPNIEFIYSQDLRVQDVFLPVRIMWSKNLHSNKRLTFLNDTAQY